MKKLFLLKKGNMIFYACLWDFGRYSIERITKAVGFTVKFFDTLDIATLEHCARFDSGRLFSLFFGRVILK